MEDGLGEKLLDLLNIKPDDVLILVLMEDGLGVYEYEVGVSGTKVLILVLMEDGLGELCYWRFDFHRNES